MEHFWVATAMTAIWVAIWAIVLSSLIIYRLHSDLAAARRQGDESASARLLREILGWIEALGFSDSPGQANGLKARIRRHLGLPERPFVPYASADELD